jgi:hypothetical protein
MLTPNIPPSTPEWALPDRCQCACVCALTAHRLDPHLWRDDARRGCGCCVASCVHCSHGAEAVVVLPRVWDGDQA